MVTLGLHADQLLQLLLFLSQKFILERPTDMKWKKTLVFILFLLTGIILGALLSGLCSRVGFLSWLCIGQTVGVGYPTPIAIDLSVVKLSFGFAVEINIIKMICIIFCLWLYKLFSKGL